MTRVGARKAVRLSEIHYTESSTVNIGEERALKALSTIKLK
jgi:hypothetical protein